MSGPDLDARCPGIRDVRVCGRGRLIGTATIAGVDFHADFYRVRQTTDGWGERGEFDCDDRGDAEQHHAAANADGPWQTIQVRGVHYALVLTPHCE